MWLMDAKTGKETFECEYESVEEAIDDIIYDLNDLRDGMKMKFFPKKKILLLHLLKYALEEVEHIKEKS